MVELSDEDVAGYRNFMRVDPDMFREILERIGDRIRKQDTWFRKALEPGLKLAITLRHLATGDNYKSLMYGFRVSSNTISLIVGSVPWQDTMIWKYNKIIYGERNSFLKKLFVIWTDKDQALISYK